MIMNNRLVFAGLALSVSLTGCAELIPNTISPEFEHESHALQHVPFTSNPTNYGGEKFNLVAGWKITEHVNLSLAEGIDLDRKGGAYANGGVIPIYGESVGPREQFTGRVSYTFHVRE